MTDTNQQTPLPTLLPAQATQAEVTDADIVAVMRDGNNCNYNDEAEHIQFARAILALRPAATFCGYCGGNDEDPVDHCMDCTRPAAVPMTDAHPMQPIVIAKDGRIRFKKNQIVDDLYELRKVHKLDLNEMACRNYSQEDRNQFAQLIGYSVDGWGTLSYAIDVEKADAIAEALAAQAKKEGV